MLTPHEPPSRSIDLSPIWGNPGIIMPKKLVENQIKLIRINIPRQNNFARVSQYLCGSSCNCAPAAGFWNFTF